MIMKTIGWMKVAMMFVAGTFVFTACDDDDNKFAAPEAVQAAFNQQYGDATRVEWERERNGYLVADVGNGKVVPVHPDSVIKEKHGD